MLSIKCEIKTCEINTLFIFFTCACLFWIVSRLLELISSDTISIELKVESVVILGSLAKGPEHVVQCVFDSGVMPLLLKGTVAPF